MDVIRIVAIGIIACVVIIIIKQIKPEFAIVALVASSIIMLFYIFTLFTDVLGVFNEIIIRTGINYELFTIIIKIIGVGYLIEFGASICADSGNSAIADKVILAGKLLILVLAIPILTSLLDIVVSLL